MSFVESNLIIKVQNAVIQKINDIFKSEKDPINIFTVLPLKKKPPYFKLNQISISDQYTEELVELTIDFEIFAITEGRTNKQLIFLIEILRKELSTIILTEKNIKILNILNFSASIKNDIMLSNWTGYVRFSLTVSEDF